MKAQLLGRKDISLEKLNNKPLLLRYTVPLQLLSPRDYRGTSKAFGKPWAASVAEATGGDSVDPLSFPWRSQQGSGHRCSRKD